MKLKSELIVAAVLMIIGFVLWHMGNTSEQEATHPTKPNSHKESCITNVQPIFSHHITDIDLVDSIVPPFFWVGDSDLKHTALMNTRGRVPLYLPSDATLFQGSHYVSEGEDHYLLDFQASCEIIVSFDHVTEPIDEIVALLPHEAQSDSRTEFVEPLEMHAGDLIGYTTGTINAKNWNFAVFNSVRSNHLVDHSDYSEYEKYTTAVCPFEYYPDVMRDEYENVFISDFGDVRVDKQLCSLDP